MKKRFSFVFFVALGLFLCGNELLFDQQEDGSFTEWKQDTSVQYQPLGLVTPIVGSQRKALRIEAKTAPVSIIARAGMRWSIGKVLQIDFTFSGEGEIAVGGHFYNGNYKWLVSSNERVRGTSKPTRHTVYISDVECPSDPIFVHPYFCYLGLESQCVVADVTANLLDIYAVNMAETFPAGGLDSVSAEGTAALFAAKKDNFRAVIPKSASAMPRIDGKIDEDEWAGAAKIAGFAKPNKGLLPNEFGYGYLICDQQFLYLAVKTSAPNNDPGAGLISNASARDGAVYDDDSVELTLIADTDLDICYHLIFNAKNVIFDRKVRYSENTSEVGWNAEGLELASDAKSSVWDLEIKIPLASIGNPQKYLKCNVARNWFSYGASAINPAALHIDPICMGQFFISDNLPYLRVHSLGEATKGKWEVELEAVNPSPHPYRLSALLRSYYWNKKADKSKREMRIDSVQELELPAEKTIRMSLRHTVDSPDMRFLSTVITDASGISVFSRQVMALKEQFNLSQPGLGITEIPGVGSVQCWHYPGYDKARLLFQLDGDVLSSEITADFGAGQRLVERSNDGIQAVVPMPTTAGVYSLTLGIKGQDGKRLTLNTPLKINQKRFPWEANNLGKEKIILPPFTPLSLHGDELGLILRHITFNRMGLWDSLQALDRELLAAPMRWELISNGQKRNLTASPLHLQLMDGGYSLDGNAVLHSDDDIELRTKIHFEYDGFCWLELSLKNPLRRRIDRLSLVVSLRDSEVPLYHVIANGIRSNPSGNLPAGDGEIWHSGKLRRNSGIHPQLVPHIWLGGVERGLAWFTDSSYGYRLGKKQSSLRLLRRGDQLIMEIDFINQPTVPKDGHAFAFGLQATPVKPTDRALRAATYDCGARGVPGMLNMQSLIEAGMLGFPSQWAKLPEQGDYTLMKTLAEGARSGQAFDFKTAQEIYFKKYDAETQAKIEFCPKTYSYEGFAHHRSCRSHAASLAFSNPLTPSLPYKYSDPRLVFFPNEVPKYFQSEWWIGEPGYFGAWRTYPVPSNLDYLVYGYYQEIKNGMHGVYLDDVFIIPNGNPDTVARIDEQDETHPQLGILALRELIKRIAVIQHQFNQYPRLLIVHMTNAQLIPCFAFATCQLAWEDQFGESPLPTRYTLDSIRAEGLGVRLGMDSTALGGLLRKTTSIEDWPAKKRQLSRSFLTLALPHEVKIWNRPSPNDFDWSVAQPVYQKMSEFGHWRDDCEFIPYWEKNPALRVDSSDVILSAYVRPNAVLLIASNLKDEAKVSVSLDYEHFNLGQDSACVNLETGEKEDLKQLRIGKYDFKLLKIGGQQ